MHGTSDIIAKSSLDITMAKTISAIATTTAMVLTACSSPSNADSVHKSPASMQNLDQAHTQAQKNQLHDRFNVRTIAQNVAMLGVWGDMPVWIDGVGELWHMANGTPQKMGVRAGNVLAPAGMGDKLAFAMPDGALALYQNGRITTSAVQLSPHSALLWHKGALYAVLQGGIVGKFDDNLQLQARYPSAQALAHHPNMQVLADARMVSHPNGIVVLATPRAYGHGVLGDGVEAGAMVLLSDELSPRAELDLPKDLVFEANTVAVSGTHIAVVISSQNEGARVALLDSTLSHIGKSRPLPYHRWQSPFWFDGALYAVQMPHIKGDLVRYQLQGNTLQASVLDTALSNHAIGMHDTDIGARTSNWLLLPTLDGRVQARHKDGQVYMLNLGARVAMAHAIGNSVYWRLHDGALVALDLS